MKKLILFSTLLFVGISANAQYTPSNSLNYVKLLKTPPVGSVEDSVLVYNGSDSFVKMRPSSELITKATPTKSGVVKTDVLEADPIVYTKTTLDSYLKLKEYLSTGLIKNGLITINADPTKFNVSAGIGVISNFDDPDNPVSSLVSFPAFTGVTPTYLNTGNITYIAVTKTPSVQLVMQASPFTTSQRRDLIILGATIHSNLTNINVVNNIAAPSNAIGNQLGDIAEALGALNITGNKYSANGANLQLNKSAGTIFKFGVNFANDWKNPHQLAQGAGTALTFRYRTQNGTEGSDVTSVSPGLYDNSNVLTAVPNNKFTIQTVVMFQTGLTRILYGQQVYDDLATAKNAIFTRNFNMEANAKENGIVRAYIILKNNTTSLLTTTDAEIIEAQKFGGVASGGVALTFANIVTALGYTPANDVDVLHKTLDEIKNGKLGLNTTILDSNVSDLKIGNRVPSDDNNIVAISKDYSAGNAIYNGLNIEIKSTSTINNDLRVNRALKSVALVDPAGFTLGNEGGSGQGVEGVSRLQGLGTVKALTGGYFRVLQDTNNPLAILEVANGVVIPTPGGFSGAPIGTAVGLNINEQNYLSRSTNSINFFVGSPNLNGLLPVGLTGRYSIYNMSDEYNYFKSRLGLNITAPTEILDVVGNGKFSGNLGIGTVSTSARANLSGSITGATTAYGIFNQAQVQSDVTNIAYYNRTSASTQAASFTLSTLIHNSATQGTFGVGSTVTNQYGFIAASSLTGATNNYGFRGQIPSNASANWNTYNDGTAPNYFNGNVGIGTLPAVSATDKLQVNGNITASAATASTHVVIKSQHDLKANIDSQIFTGDPKAPTPTAGDNDTSIATTAFVTGAIATAIPYKKYVILITQTGTSAPTVNLLENTLGQTVSFSYIGVGQYRLTSTGTPFIANKSVIFTNLTSGFTQGAYGFRTSNFSTNTIDLYTFSNINTSTLANDILNFATIEIRVYP